MIQLRSVRIGELGRVITGKTPPSERPELFGEIHPFLTPTDIDGIARYVTPSRYLSDQGRLFQSQLMIPVRAVCVVCIGATIGKICVTDRPSFTNQQINAVIVDESKHDPFFIYYLITTLREELKAKAGGAATPIINKTTFSNIQINVPSLPIQRRIASILSAYDDLIENNRKRIAILEEMARRLYREWFVHFRYPGHESVPLVDSPLGRIPQGWEIRQLGQVASVNPRQISSSSAPELIAYIDIASVSPGIIEAITPMAFSDAPGRARRIVRDGNVIWSCVRPNRRSFALTLDPDENTIASTGFAFLEARHIPWSFLYHSVTTEAFVGWLVGRAQGAAYPAVRAEDFSESPLIIPPSQILSAFHTHAEPWARLANNLHKQNLILRRIRDLLLPRLMSGQLSVTAAEAAAP